MKVLLTPLNVSFDPSRNNNNGLTWTEQHSPRGKFETIAPYARNTSAGKRKKYVDFDFCLVFCWG